MILHLVWKPLGGAKGTIPLEQGPIPFSKIYSWSINEKLPIWGHWLNCMLRGDIPRERDIRAHMWYLSAQPNTVDGLKGRRTSHSSDKNAPGQSLALTHSEPWKTMASSGPGQRVSEYHTCHQPLGIRECLGFNHTGSSPTLVWNHLGLGKIAHNKVGSQLSINVLVSLFVFFGHLSPMTSHREVLWIWVSLVPQTLCYNTVSAHLIRISYHTKSTSWLTWTYFLGWVQASSRISIF